MTQKCSRNYVATPRKCANDSKNAGNLFVAPGAKSKGWRKSGRIFAAQANCSFSCHSRNPLHYFSVFHFLYSLFQRYFFITYHFSLTLFNSRYIHPTFYLQLFVYFTQTFDLDPTASARMHRKIPNISHFHLSLSKNKFVSLNFITKILMTDIFHLFILYLQVIANFLSLFIR